MKVNIHANTEFIPKNDKHDGRRGLHVRRCHDGSEGGGVMELKPCPLCRGGADTGCCDGFVLCRKCGLMVSRKPDDLEDAEDAWNALPRLDDMEAENRRLREALNQMLADGLVTMSYVRQYGGWESIQQARAALERLKEVE